MTIFFCRGCERYLNPPVSWIQAELESRELLTLCLKRLKGLSKVRNRGPTRQLVVVVLVLVLELVLELVLLLLTADCCC